MSDGTETVTKAKEKAKEKVAEAKDAAKGGSKDAAEGGGLGSLVSKAAVPVAAAAGTLVSSYAVKKVPDLLRARGGEEAEKLGKRALESAQSAVSEKGGIAGKAAEKLLGGGDGDGGDDDGSGAKQPAKGWGRGRRLPIQCSVDVAVPIEVAYDQWTQFEDFPEFMHRVEQIEQKEDDTLVWHENVWGVRRSWESQIVEQIPDERIVWRSDDRGGHSGVVTFHELSDRLTRVELNVDLQPEGMFEKLASGLRFHRRALKTDLQRYKAFVEMRNEETGAWREEIHEEDENPAREATEGMDNGNSSSRNGGSDDDSNSESSRQEREERRRQRREGASASR
jgi:uncharacterized membrane protein